MGKHAACFIYRTCRVTDFEGKKNICNLKHKRHVRSQKKLLDLFTNAVPDTDVIELRMKGATILGGGERAFHMNVNLRYDPVIRQD